MTETISLVGEVFLLAFLLAMSIWDVKYKAVPRWMLICALAAAILANIGALAGQWGKNLLGIGFGFIILCLWLIVGKIREAVGFADIALIGLCGFTFEETVFLSGIFVAGGLVAMLALIRFCKDKKKEEIPFVPFLFVGMILGKLGEMIFYE